VDSFRLADYPEIAPGGSNRMPSPASLRARFWVCRLKMVLSQTSEKATCQAVTAELDSASFSIGIANLRLAIVALRKNQGEPPSHMPR
jgi:hypothetical protein